MAAYEIKLKRELTEKKKTEQRNNIIMLVEFARRFFNSFQL